MPYCYSGTALDPHRRIRSLGSSQRAGMSRTIGCAARGSRRPAQVRLFCAASLLRCTRSGFAEQPGEIGPLYRNREPIGADGCSIRLTCVRRFRVSGSGVFWAAKKSWPVSRFTRGTGRLSEINAGANV
jgi:hypothetical protein